MSKQGRHNSNQTRAEIEKQDEKNSLATDPETQIGNSQHQSQKKSGRQRNKQ
ncbi:hypothetical protein [Litchfieldia salsa]|uniref:Uncharacterized protein n=1 Tax=Litchfieldia salsa TaxID=930152 RepID=A0A1H0TJC9_9BACI|nr:hypothetical protein [Litchfieldia salsa]SDP53931.1 hypothetical protein SAMN05216565_103555 [Litchfieldia salsa]